MSFLRKFIRNKEPAIPFCSAVIVAAGSSERMGYDKLRAELLGVPVIVRTISAFENAPCIREIIVVTRSDSVADMADVCRQNGFSKVTKVICGGDTRAQSSLAGVCEVNPRAKLVAIHDGARPLVTESVITNTVVSAAEKMAVAPAVKPTDTVKITDKDGMVVETLDRERAVMMQTPQVFNADLIKGALTRAAEDGAVITDDCAAVEAIGMNVFVIEGDRDNIKLTTPMDMLIAEKILKDRGGDR